jgi:hypothetical protein
LVKIIDVARNRQRTHDFFMTMIRISGLQLRACLWSSRAKRPASGATASASDERRHPLGLKDDLADGIIAKQIVELAAKGSDGTDIAGDSRDSELAACSTAEAKLTLRIGIRQYRRGAQGRGFSRRHSNVGKC